MCPGFVSLKVTKTQGLRPATKGDLEEIHSLLQANLHKCQLSTTLSLEEVEHWLLPRENVVDTYVVEVNITVSCRAGIFRSFYNLKYHCGIFFLMIQKSQVGNIPQTSKQKWYYIPYTGRDWVTCLKLYQVKLKGMWFRERASPVHCNLKGHIQVKQVIFKRSHELKFNYKIKHATKHYKTCREMKAL